MARVLGPGEFLGETLDAAEHEGVRLSITEHLPHLSCDPHGHESTYLCFIISGGFQERASRSERLCEAGTLLYHPALHVHSDVLSSAGARCLNIEISTADLPLFARISDCGRASWAAARLLRAFREKADVSSAVGELKSAIRAAKPKLRADWLAQAQEILATGFAKHLSLEEIADSCGVHPMHLSRAFRQAYGKSVGQALRETRLRAATQLLLRSESPLADVAASCGFYGQSHLTNTLRKHVGFTPSELRSLAA